MDTPILTSKLNYEEFSVLFGMWAEKFKPFIEGKEMFEIYQKIKKDSEKEIIVPGSDNVFRAFTSTFPEEIKTVWYMMDPYPKRYKNRKFQATGIAMDCSNSPDGKMQPSLEKFYDAMIKDTGKEVQRSLSLEYLCHQGMMLLNTDLTCKLNKTGSHERLWEPFQKFFLQEVMGNYTGIIYVLCGKASHRMERYIYPPGNYIIKLDHPVSASYKDTEWDCKGVFTRINRLLKENNGTKIYWDKREWDIIDEPPF